MSIDIALSSAKECKNSQTMAGIMLAAVIIDSSHKLSADNVDDTSTTNKFVTASEKTDIGNTTAKVEGITSSTNNSITFGNGVTLYIGSTAPSSPNDGDYWLD